MKALLSGTMWWTEVGGSNSRTRDYAAGYAVRVASYSLEGSPLVWPYGSG